MCQWVLGKNPAQKNPEKIPLPTEKVTPEN